MLHKINKYSTSFQDIWLSNADYKDWLRKDNASNDAFCKFCQKKSSVSAMGESAIKSHAKGKFHLSRAPSPSSIVSFFPKKNNSSELLATSSTSNTNSLGSSNKDQRVDTMLLNDAVVKAEIRWVLKVILSNYSMNSCSEISKLFAEMFNCPVSEAFKLGPTKCHYFICHGIAPYFTELLLNEIKNSLYIVISFDECFNRINQKGQMDLVLRYWTTDRVATRYLSSSFMGKASAEDVLEHFRKGCSKIEERKIVQVSSDGPNVNLKFLELLCENRNTEELPDLISIGTCGLHTIHKGFQHGATDSTWPIKKILGGMWKILDQSPSRRADYERVTESKTYPLRFCPHRWVENEMVAKRAEPIWDDFVTLINYWQTLPKKKQPDQENKSYVTLREAVKDPLVKAKFKFFEMIAIHPNKFLKLYQTDNPMVPFLTTDIAFVYRNLLMLFIRKPILDDATSVVKLAKIDPQLNLNQKLNQDVDIGFRAKAVIAELKKKGLITATKILTFKTNCKAFLARLCQHIVTKSPMLFKFARNATCIDPKLMATAGEESITKFSVILDILVQKKWMSSKDADESKTQFQQFLHHDLKVNREQFISFDRNKERLDSFLFKYIGHTTAYSQMWKPIQLVLTLSHGQASVERGFSVNKELLVENLQEETLVAQKVIYDHMKYHDVQPHNIEIKKELLIAIRGARTRYGIALEEKKKEKVESEKQLKRKQLDEDIADVMKKKRIAETIKTLFKDADQYAKDAEKKQDFTLLAKSNSFRNSARKKEADIVTLEETLKMLTEKKSGL